MLYMRYCYLMLQWMSYLSLQKKKKRKNNNATIFLSKYIVQYRCQSETDFSLLHIIYCGHFFFCFLDRRQHNKKANLIRESLIRNFYIWSIEKKNVKSCVRSVMLFFPILENIRNCRYYVTTSYNTNTL